MDANQWRNFPELYPILLWEDVPPLWQDGMPAQDDGIQDRPSLTPFLVDNAPRGAVIVFPGGGYAMKAMHEAEPIARWLNAGGIHAFVLNYRVAPFRHPAPLLDAQRAIRYVRCHADALHVRPDHIGIIGFSAGGHLAATAAAMEAETAYFRKNDPVDGVSSRPDAAVLCYPVISMRDGIVHEGSRACLLGVDGETPEALSLSADARVNAMTPPTFLWHTADDEAVPVANSLLMGSALAKNGICMEMHIFPHGHHGMGLAQGDPVVGRWPVLAMDFLKNLDF